MHPEQNFLGDFLLFDLPCKQRVTPRVPYFAIVILHRDKSLSTAWKASSVAALSTGTREAGGGIATRASAARHFTRSDQSKPKEDEQIKNVTAVASADLQKTTIHCSGMQPMFISVVLFGANTWVKAVQVTTNKKERPSLC